VSLAAVGGALAQRQTRILPGANAREPIAINADNLDYFDKEQKLVYSGSVIARQGESSLRSSTLTIHLTGSPAQPGEASGGNGPANSQVKRMEAAGPVTVVSKDQVGTGDRGVYEKAENRIHLIGNVSLTQGTNVIHGSRGSRLVYDLSSGRARITGGVSSLFTPGSDDPTRKKTAGRPRP
jgi:lipopolysaccharide export system protein LptA